MIIRIVKEHNPSVFAGEGWVLVSPFHEESDFGGTFLSLNEAYAASYRIFQQTLGDNRILKSE